MLWALTAAVALGFSSLAASGVVWEQPSETLGARSASSSNVRQQPPTNSVSAIYSALSQCAPSLAERERWRIAGAIHHEGRRFGYDPLFVLAMVEVESSCSPTALGPRGAVGFIQVKPSTARALAAEAGQPWPGAEMLKRPVFNLQIGLRYLAQLEEHFQDPYLAIAAYNMGPTRVARMSPHRARGARYVRRILTKYADLEAAVPSA